MKLSEKLSDWVLRWRWRNQADEEFQDLEAALNGALVPVDPQPQFVSGLRKNLLRQLPGVDLAPSRSQNQALQTGLLVASGILGSVVIVLTGVRGLVSLMGVIGLLVSLLRQNTEDPASAAPGNLAH